MSSVHREDLWHVRLARAVLLSAIEDIQGAPAAITGDKPSARAAARADAIAFVFSDQPDRVAMRNHWCMAAEVHPEWLQRRARLAMRGERVA